MGTFAKNVTLSAQIDEMLDAVQQGRGRRLLWADDVLELIDRVVDGEGYAARHGGELRCRLYWESWTTVAMVARVDGEVYLGVGRCHSNAPTPGRVWGDLAPWGDTRDGRQGPRGETAGKIREWVRRPDVIRITPILARTPVS
jgi:hypothetical protein